MVEAIKHLWERLSRELSKVVVGKQDVVEKIFISLLAGGHVLLEGVPGIAKTHIAKNFSAALGCKFKRIQFTPDLLPMDILGSNVYIQRTGEFVFREGPIFANVVLADEVNRSPPKTQSALLECMQERQVTVEGKTYPLPSPFIVLATQNPIELEGTYPLPEAQVDRFLMKILVDYPSKEEELQILELKEREKEVKPVTSAREIVRLSKEVEKVYVDPSIRNYIAELVLRTRKSPDLLLGASPRASLSLQLTSRVHAALRGRDFVIPDDVKAMLIPVLNHRLILRPEAELEGKSVLDVIRSIESSVEVPRLKG
ncbi:MAG: MoxR family ATPase [Candidatus Hadarchaeales archaeon]